MTEAPPPKAPLTGRCQCGLCRFEITEDPLRLYMCFCSECRRQASSTHGVSLLTPARGFRLVSGRLKTWRRDTASGAVMACSFCPECGSRVHHQSSEDADILSVKGGLIDGLDLTGAAHCWTGSALNGAPRGDGPQHPASLPRRKTAGP